MLKAIRKFGVARSGMAAVEFALVAPFMITLFFGLVEVCNILDAQQKVTSVASTAADLTGQATTVKTTDIADIFAASSAIMTPFSNANTTIVLSSVTGTGIKNKGIVLWSQVYGHGATARAVNSNVVIGTNVADGSLAPSMDGLLPTTCSSAGQCSVILAEVYYNYTSPYGKFIIGSRTLTDTFLVKPRRVISVPCTDCT